MKKIDKGARLWSEIFHFLGFDKDLLTFLGLKFFILFSWVSNCDAVYFLGVRLKDLES